MTEEERDAVEAEPRGPGPAAQSLSPLDRRHDGKIKKEQKSGLSKI